MSTRFRWVVWTLVLGFCGIATASADRYGENAALARLVHEIALLETLVNDAESQTDQARRVQFRYDWLRHDLARIRLGIQEHINAPTPVPRSVKPLRGDYRR